jgi:hypothetical protein
MGSRARDFYLNCFTFEIMYQKHLELYHSMAMLQDCQLLAKDEVPKR